MMITREGILQLEFALLILYGVIMIFKKVKLNRILICLSFGLYISLIIAVCFFPMEIKEIGQSIPNNFIPFKSIYQSLAEVFKDKTPYGLISVFGNFVMLMPLGIFLQYYTKDLKSRLVDIILFAVSIETIQFIIGLLIGYNYRCIDIDDVILNSAGGILSCICIHFITKKWAKKHA